MENEITKLQDIIKSSQKILITSHISPDPDAVSSALLLGTTLKYNYPKKQIEMVLEEQPSRDLSFLEGYKDIKFQSLLDSVEVLKPDLFIVVDANNFSRITRLEGEQIKTQAQNGNFKTIAIDHHEEGDKDQFDVFINNHSIATTQDIYSLCFGSIGLKKPAGYADTTMLGIVADSNRFKYADSLHRQTFAIVSDLIDAGANIEKIESRLERYDLNQMQVIGHLAKRLTISDEGYNYSFIEDAFYDEIVEKTESKDVIVRAIDEFANRYIRNIEKNLWGFIVFRDISSGPGVYSASFRSLGGVKDVSVIARKLGGGGHKPAAGAKFEADSVEQAIEKVKQAIKTDSA